MRLKTRLKIYWRKMLTLMGALALIAAAVTGLMIYTGHQTPEAPQQETEPEKSALLPNPYDRFSFRYEGDYLTCVDGESTLGIDVSEWQSTIDWQKVRQAGVEFVMIRIGWRGGEKGELYPDSMAQNHYRGAKAAGLKVGCYFFSQAVTVAEAIEEAKYALELSKDWELDLPIAFDWEHTSDDFRTTYVGRATLTACATAFCDTILAAGHETMIYFYWDLMVNRLDLEALAEYPFWFAMYVEYTEFLDFEYRVDMWQYTIGRVPGVKEDVDINLWLTYDDQEVAND